MNSHVCPVAGCTRLLPWSILMCRQHWALVPRPLQRQVYRAWNDGTPAPDYLAVRQAAVDAVDAQITVPEARG